MVVIESRQERNDRKDRQVLAALAAMDFDADFRYTHELPQNEPLLWVADALAGAVSADLAGRDREYAARLAGVVDRIPITI